MTPLSTVHAAVLIMSWYCIAISAIAFWCMIAVIAPLAFLLAFMILMWAGACWWKSTLLISDTISWSIWLAGSTLSSLLEIRCLTAMLNRVVGLGPGSEGAFGLCVGVWTVSHPLSGICVRSGWGLGSCRGSGCSVSCRLGLGFGCCCRSWCSSGSPSCIVPTCCVASRSPPLCLAVSSLPYFLASWASDASHFLSLASNCTVTSAIPVPHSTLFLWCSSHFVSQSSSHSFMPSHCASSRAACASSILAILLIVWFSWVTSNACCLTVRSTRLLQSCIVLPCSGVSFRSLFPSLWSCHCPLSDMHDTRTVFPDPWPSAPLTFPVSAMARSLSTGGFAIVPPVRLLPSWVASVVGLLEVA